MRYLVFGDVHANLLALDVVLAAGVAHEVEAYLFVGDLVGYGPNPLECIERLLPLKEQGSLAWVAGNHELVVRGEVEPDGYSGEALETLNWTRALLAATPAAREFVAAAPLSLQVNEGIWLTHDSLAQPGCASYHRWPQKAKSELACLRYHRGRVCFYGHTHTMRAEVIGGEPDIMLAPMEAHAGEGVDTHPLRLGTDGLGWIGTGSVGLPTNPERAAEFLILDDAEWTIEKYAVPYPRQEARQQVVAVVGKACSSAVAERIARWL
jgi:predicted phosphodiesterase